MGISSLFAHSSHTVRESLGKLRDPVIYAPSLCYAFKERKTHDQIATGVTRLDFRPACLITLAPFLCYDQRVSLL